MPPTPMNSQSPIAQSSSEETTTYNEAPLNSVPPGISVIAPAKPLMEMSDEELQSWHSHLCEHRVHQVMTAHLRSPTTKKEKTEPQRDISEYE